MMRTPVRLAPLLVAIAAGACLSTVLGGCSPADSASIAPTVCEPVSAGFGGNSSGGPDAPVAAPNRRVGLQLQTWKFIASDTLLGAESVAFDDASWAPVSVPHTWDTVAGVTAHSNSWYRTHFTIAPGDAQRRFYVYFEGAFQVADVFVNGHKLGEHRGGYTRFVYDATPAMVTGDNVLAVMVSGADCNDCLPNGAPRLFKGYGGLYRKVWLFSTGPYHIATTDFASSGVYVSTPAVDASSSTLSARILLTNDGGSDQIIVVSGVLNDAAGNAVLTSQATVAVAAGTTVTTTLGGTLPSPHLWSHCDPYLYQYAVTVTVSGMPVDSIREPVGFRWYRLTTTDFVLNGASTPLRGMSKHQESEYNASAVSDAELVADWDDIQELGLNYMRLVHYPHAQLEYDLADQRGVMVWAENGHTNPVPLTRFGPTGFPTPNADNICREMVFQNWNHPSIVFFSAGNEAGNDAATTEYARVLREADPSRPVVYASNGQNPAEVDYIFRNTYPGWYTGTMYDFLTGYNAWVPWVSESGAGSVVSTHTSDPFETDFIPDSFEPEEYGALVDEVRFDDLLRNPSHTPAFSGFAFRDISDIQYKGVLNSKGLITFAGYKKDIFYHLKSLLRAAPVVHLVGPHYFLRAAPHDSLRGGSASGQGPVKAYSNAAALTLSINGNVVGTRSNGEYAQPYGTAPPFRTPIRDVFFWPDALQPGKNVVIARDAGGNADSMTVYYLGPSSTLPADPAAKVTNLTSSNGPAYFLDVPIADQHPVYVDFDGTGDNTFDVVPQEVAGASFIATRRQSADAKRTDLAFDLPVGASVYVLFTTQPTVPAWVSAAGFADTRAPCRWRDDTLKLVGCSLFRKTFPAGSHVALATTAIDYIVLVK
jgi:beta-galactosidase